MPPESNAPAWATKSRFTKAGLYATRAWFFANSTKDQLDCSNTKCAGLIAVIYQSGLINPRARPTLHKRCISMTLDDYSIQNTAEQARLKCHVARIQARRKVSTRARPSVASIGG